ncbi:MAG: prolipoprotein diacylglyceryl transferase [Clostridium sp.]
MKPELFNILGISVKGYGLMIAIGIIAAIILLDKRRASYGYDEDKIWNMTIITILSGLLGGKLLYIVTDFKELIGRPLTLENMGYGFVIYGAIISGTIVIWMYCRKQKWDTLNVLDLVIPSIPLAQGFGRIGCLLAGCCYGGPTTLPFGIEFKNSPFVDAGVHRHPTQIYSAIFGFCLAAFLIWYDKNKEHKDGQLVGLYFIIYSIGRFIVEYLRVDPRGNIGMLSTSQFIAIFTLIFGIGLYNIHKLRRKSS